MNIFLIPQWGKEAKPIKDRPKVPNFIGVQNEVIRDDNAAIAHITITVRGIKSTPSGSYKLAHQPGMKLGQYFTRLRLKKAATYAAVYDYSNLERGRCRMSYIPEVGAEILIGPASLGPAVHLQRTNHDAQRVAANMGETPGSPAVKTVERRK